MRLSNLIINTIENTRYFPSAKILTINNKKMLLHPNKSGLNRDLYIYKKREPNTTDLLLNTNIIKPYYNILEVGANIGYYALIETQKTKGVIYAVEPVTENYYNLISNIQLNEPNRIIAKKLAFGEKDELTKIYISKTLNWCTLNKTGIRQQTGVQTIQKTTIDKFVKNTSKIHFMRMDVEGYEYEILKGATQTLKTDIKILMEIHPPIINNLTEFFEILKQNNYKAKYIIFENKTAYNHALYSMFKKYAKNAPSLPEIHYNKTIKQLEQLIKNNRIIPNVLLTK